MENVFMLAVTSHNLTIIKPPECDPKIYFITRDHCMKLSCGPHNDIIILRICNNSFYSACQYSTSDPIKS